MHISLRSLIPLGLTLSALHSTPVQSEEFYRWRDTKGVAHYGHTPPRGVNASKVKIYGGGPGSAARGKTAGAQQKPAATAEPNNTPPGDRAERDKRCRAERQRLATLQANQPIRMKRQDGSLKYLDKQEIAREIQLSNDYLQADCRDTK